MTTSTQTLDLTQLREVAEAARKSTGEWRLRRYTDCRGWRDDDRGLYGKYGYIVRPGVHGGMFNDHAAAQHAATFDPPMILALLDRLAALEGER